MQVSAGIASNRFPPAHAVHHRVTQRMAAARWPYGRTAVTAYLEIPRPHSYRLPPYRPTVLPPDHQRRHHSAEVVRFTGHSVGHGPLRAVHNYGVRVDTGFQI